MIRLLLDFIFPKSCLQCGNLITENQTAFCLHCYHHLPFTQWKWNSENLMQEKLSAYLNIEQANSLFYFRKGSGVQKLLHSLKYHHRKDLSQWMADEFCHRSQLDENQGIECILPVPIHLRKLNERGYNQNTEFGMALSKLIKSDYQEHILKRIKHQKSQTLMHKAERLSRLENTFEINDLPKDYDHFLIVDDVCTTGATLLHCARLLLKMNKKVSIATMAIAI